MAESYDTFDIIAKKENINSYDKFISNARKVFKFENREIDNLVKQFNNKKLKEITLKKNTTIEEFTKLSVDQYLLPEMELIVKSNRRYIFPEATSHVLGYTGKLSENDFNSIIEIKEGMTTVGKIGVERFYQNLLSGSPGYEKLETNANNEIIRVLEKKSATRGSDVFLTIDVKLQNYVYGLLKGQRGSIIVMNPHNGDVQVLLATLVITIIYLLKVFSKDYKKLPQ